MATPKVVGEVWLAGMYSFIDWQLLGIATSRQVAKDIASRHVGPGAEEWADHEDISFRECHEDTFYVKKMEVVD